MPQAMPAQPCAPQNGQETRTARWRQTAWVAAALAYLTAMNGGNAERFFGLPPQSKLRFASRPTSERSNGKGRTRRPFSGWRLSNHRRIASNCAGAALRELLHAPKDAPTRGLLPLLQRQKTRRPDRAMRCIYRCSCAVLSRAQLHIGASGLDFSRPLPASHHLTPPSMGNSIGKRIWGGVMIKSIGVVLALALLFAGCATTANYEAKLQSWVGQPVDNLVASWGPPESSYTLTNGGRVLQYANQRNMQIGGNTYTTPQTTYNAGTANIYGTGGYATGTYSGTSTTYVQQQAPTYNIALTCVTRITANSSGIITNWAWQGNNCTSTK